MFKRLLTPRWIGALVLAGLFAVACYHLGHWQYGRHLAKVERNARLDANYTAAPRPVTEVIGPTALPLDRQWTRVTATGTYAGSAPVYVRNRPNQGGTGYEVVEAFHLDAGGVLLVDRGWVQADAARADILPPAPAAPSGTVTITGWAMPGEDSLGRTLPAGQLASINLPEAAAATHESLLGGYVRLEEERTAAGAVADRPAPLDPPDRSLGPHQAYAYQWWLTMPLGLGLIWFGIRRELQAETAAADVAAGRPLRAPKPKKVRIWDEEDA